MFLSIVSDANPESGVSPVIHEISGRTQAYFRPRHYGEGFRGIGIVLMCRNPALNFKRRLRLSKKDLTLYMDIMFDLPVMSALNHEERRSEIVRRLYEEVPATVERYRKKIPAFDCDSFIADLRAWLLETLVVA